MAETFQIGARGEKAQRRLLWLIMIAVLAFIAWASFSELDEVAVGDAKVIPYSRSQMIQSLEGGAVAQLDVHEGDVVNKDQVLARLDPVMAEATRDEAMAKIVGLKARAARLDAEMRGAARVTFPEDVQAQPEVAAREQAVFKENRAAISQTLSDLGEQRKLASQQLELALPLLKTGASNDAEILRLREKVADLNSRINAARNEYDVALKKDYAQTMAELEPLEQVARGRAYTLKRTEIRSPVRGIVKEIRVSTIGGVVSPGGVLMEIVPLGDELLVEARINPRDIAFIKPEQQGMVKITAYDSSIYGTLEAAVETVSPDSVVDEVDRRSTYYKVQVRTKKAYLETKDGKHHPITPGMVASVEIRTGRKTVLSYLLKPLQRAAEALRER
ncbi:MAG: HlyD family efflux transporter periplasmic adaptor subunit [Burkholderiaceae bacterium]|jgi:adhesin transport system membrane fusion protein|nr:HlyD family efflux transporter periplasmic adaptor subunit [Burkholderiaceae bacterium]